MASPIRNCDLRGAPATTPKSQVRGFTYVGLMFLLAMVALASALTLDVAEQSARRSAEDELLSIGQEFSRAFESYYRQSASLTQRYPTDLQELVKDPRVAGTRRHLRRIYPDPITGETKWGLIRAPGGQIMGVYSLSDKTPLRLLPAAASSPLSAASEVSSGYAAWHFGYWPRNGQPSMPRGRLSGAQ